MSARDDGATFRVWQGPLSGHYFAGLCVPDDEPGTWRCVAKKHDVTDDVRALLDPECAAREQRAGSDAMADQTTHAESAVGGSPTPFDEIDRLRDLAAATEESRVKWQLRALESESHNFGLRKFARLIRALDRTRAIDEVIEATPVGVLDHRPPVSVDFADLKGDEVP